MMELQLSQLQQQLKKITHHKAFWVFATISCLATLHLCYLWKITNQLPSLIDVLGWGSIIFLLFKKSNQLKFRSDVFSRLFGIALIFWMIARHIFSQSQSSLDVLAYFFPIITISGVLLVAFGINKLINYSSELSIATIISLPFASIYFLLKPFVHIDAQLLNFMLHYMGFAAVRQGTIIRMPNGSVEVMASCSSVSPILTMLPFVVVLLSIYPASLGKQIFVYIATIVSVIFINSIRLSLLAIFISNGNIESFDYWHTGDGAGIFSNIIVFFIAGISYKVLNQSYQLEKTN